MSSKPSLDENLQNTNALVNKLFTYEKINEIAEWLLKRVYIRPKIAIVCGTGLNGIGDLIEDAKIFPYKDIPYFPISTVASHKGNLIFGKLNTVEVVCMQGRFHMYEGYASATCTIPIKLFKILGIETVILTSAAGGINQGFKLGDIMLIKDHISIPLWSLQHPLVGANDDRFGLRFPSSNKIYCKDLRELFRKTANEINITLQEGVYVSLGGPSFETVADLRALRILGADAVGMSTSHEAMVAGYCGLKVLAFSLITNICIMDYDSQTVPGYDEVIEIADLRAKDIEKLVLNFIKKL